MKTGSENTKLHEQYMARAIELAEKGRGYTDPNPVVGAVIVKDGRIIGEGYHEKYGELHAERNAIADCKTKGNDPEGADIYVTLEPCCHYGKTPPCTQAIIENKLAHVYIGSDDPNPMVAEKSKKILTAAGISQTRGILKEECDALNTKFFHYITTGMPYVTLKYAMTADGKIASRSGKSQWITGEEAREYVHRLRHEHAGIMAGIGTVLADDPMLSCRLKHAGPKGPSDPVRIIMDTHLRIPIDSKIVKTANEIRTIIVTSADDHEKQAVLSGAGCEIIKAGLKENEDGHASSDITQAMKILGKMKISGILLEGGGTLAYSALSAGVVNKVEAFVAPKILGGKSAKTPVRGYGYDDPNNCISMDICSVSHFGEDILIEFDVKRK